MKSCLVFWGTLNPIINRELFNMTLLTSAHYLGADPIPKNAAHSQN